MTRRGARLFSVPIIPLPRSVGSRFIAQRSYEARWMHRHRRRGVWTRLNAGPVSKAPSFKHCARLYLNLKNRIEIQIKKWAPFERRAGRLTKDAASSISCSRSWLRKLSQASERSLARSVSYSSDVKCATKYYRLKTWWFKFYLFIRHRHLIRCVLMWTRHLK